MGTLFNLLFRGLFAALVRFVRGNINHPFLFGGIYTAVIAFSLMVQQSLWLALFVVAVYVVCFWKFRAPYDRWATRRAFRGILFRTMEKTLWKDLKPKQFVSYSFVSDAVIRVRFSTPAGRTDEDVIKTFAVFKAALRMVDAISIPDDDPFDGRVSVLFCITSPLNAVLDGSLAPVLSDPLVVDDPYHWLPIGVDSRGEDMEIPLFLKEGGATRQLCAGMSGSGKSSIIRQQLLQATLNRHIEVLILDGKGGSEFPQFKNKVAMYGINASDFFTQLRYLEAECKRRSSVLASNKISGVSRRSQSWNHIDDGSFILWAWDELGAVMAGFDPGARHEAMTRLYGVLSIARSLGIAVIFSSQTFKADILNTQIRDNCFDIAVGYQMASIQEASYIGFEPDDPINPSKIPGKILKSGRSEKVGTFAFKGIGEPTYGRSYFISDKSILKALSRVDDVVSSIEKLVTK